MKRTYGALTMEQIILRALAHGPLSSAAFRPAYIRAGGHDFSGYAKTDVVRCRNRMVEQGAITVTWDERGEVTYHRA